METRNLEKMGSRRRAFIAASVLLVGVATGGQGVRAGDADALRNEAALVQKGMERLDRDATAIAKAFQLVERYEKSAGPLFLNGATRNGFPRKPKDGLELDYALFAIQQALIDRAYTPENLKKHRDFFEGAQFETSSYFPGKVDPPKNPNEVIAVRINASQPAEQGTPISGRDNPARRPTGCYLAPGSIAEIRVPPSLVGKGYAVRVGAHSWDLEKRPVIKRLDRVSIVYPIEERDTLVANPLGGGIYIEVPYEADAGIVSIQIKNAVRSPFFSARGFDQTTLADWKKTERSQPGPWADFETDKFMMQVPSSWVRNLEDPATLMRDWDLAMDGVSELFGHPLVRSKTVLYLQVDVTMRGSANFPGYPQSNYPYNPHQPVKGTSTHWMVRGPQYADWTVLHEVGHSQFFSKFKGEIEAAVNLPYVAVMNRKFGVDLDTAFGNAVGNRSTVSLDQTAITWMVTENFRNGRPMNISNKPGDEVKYQHRGLGKYVEIANLFGWDALGRFWTAENENYRPGDPVPQNADPVDERILRLSKAAGADLTPLIHFWGVQPDDPAALARAISSAGLKPSPAIKDRLLHYKTIIPKDNAEFRAHCRTVYPKGLGAAKNPLYGEGWYKVWQEQYDESCGQAACAALQEIVDRYFTEG